MSPQMGDTHRRFIQTMMAAGITDQQGAIALLQYCCKTHNTPHSPDKLDDFIDTINANLQPLFMQIRKGTSEDNGHQYYALVNMAETDVTRMSSDYADNELELFRKVLDLIVYSENGKASSNDILNSADSLTMKKLKKSDTEHLLNRLVRDKWLNEKHGEYTLSTRCIIEMEPYIRAMYQDQFKVCHICHNIAFQCQICEDPACGIKIHNPCVARYFNGRTEPRCPACDDFWPHEIPGQPRNMSPQMGDTHRRFIQTMMAAGITDQQGAIALLQYCCKTHNTPHSPDKLDDFIDTINANLQPLFMQIRKGTSEDNGHQYYALVNMAETDVTRMSSDYADNELELFRKVLDLIVYSENGKASSNDILNSADSLTMKKLKKSDTEHLLNRLVRDKWLNEKHGEYTLSTRCIIEMEPYIRAMYQDQFKVCHICHNIAFQCQICENPACGIKIHNPCVARYFNGRTEPRCPACDDFWPHEIPEVSQPYSRR